MMGPRRDGAWNVSGASVDLVPFWKRHLRAQIGLHGAVKGHVDNVRGYPSAVVWALTTFLQCLQESVSAKALRERASTTAWWDALCWSRLGCLAVLELRVGDVPLSGHGLPSAALALRHLEIAEPDTPDSTTVLDTPPSSVAEWLREA